MIINRFKSSKGRICTNIVAWKDKTTKKWSVSGRVTNRCRIRPYRNLWLLLCTVFRHQLFLLKFRTHESVIAQLKVPTLFLSSKELRQPRPNSSNNKFLASRIITQLLSAHRQPTRARHQTIRWTSSFRATTMVLVVSKPSSDRLWQRRIQLSTSNHC
jgi:hypothetical protein